MADAYSSENPNCEDPDFETSLFTYDCETKKSNELLTYGGLATEWKWGWVCHLNVIAGTGNIIAMKLLYNEAASPVTLFDATTKKTQEIKPFDYANWAQFKKNVLNIQEKYSLTSEWMEYVTFADVFSLKNCTGNLICDLVYNRYIDNEHSLTFSSKIDLINKTIQ